MERVKEACFAFLVLGIILGGLMGILSLNVLVSYRIDTYLKEIESQKMIIEDREKQVEKLNEVLTTKKFVVKDIEIHINCENNNDELLKVDLQKQIKKSLNVIIGKEVKNVDMEILWGILNNRIIECDKKTYSIKADKLLVSETIKVWIKATLIK